MFRELLELISLQTFRVSPVRKVWLVLKICGFVTLLFVVSGGTITGSFPNELMLLLLVGLGANIGISLLRFWIVSTYRVRTKTPLEVRDNFIIGIDSLTSATVLVVVLGSVFPIFGLPLVPFLTSLSLFSVASAWLFKEYITNFIDSYRLMFSKDFLIGDYIKLNETNKGIITDITFRATKVKTDEGDMLFIPNTTLMNTEVTNFSKVKLKRILVPFEIDRDSVSDVADLGAYLRRAVVDAFPELITDDKVELKVSGYAKDTLACSCEVSLEQYSFALEAAIKTAVYESVLRYEKGSSTTRRVTLRSRHHKQTPIEATHVPTVVSEKIR